MSQPESEVLSEFVETYPRSSLCEGMGTGRVGKSAKISRTALYQIERGNTSKPQAGTLRRISRALGVPLEILLEAPAVPSENELPIVATMSTGAAASSPMSPRLPSSDRAEELLEKFRMILASPLAEGVARIVEESFRLLPIIPPPSSGEPSRYAPPSS